MRYHFERAEIERIEMINGHVDNVDDIKNEIPIQITERKVMTFRKNIGLEKST